MKIAQISPLFESVPPRLYGGTERIVSYLTEELVNQGHEVTLFASGDSKTDAKLVSSLGTALRLGGATDVSLIYHIIQMQDVLDMADEFDVLHFHTDFLHFPIFRRFNKPVITTLHGRLDIPALQLICERFPGQRLISISYAQRAPLPGASWLDNVYHGLPENLYKPGGGTGDYVAFIGRICPEKRPDRAIEITRRAGVRLKIAAKVDKENEVYFNREIRKLLDEPHVEFIGEIGEDQKGEFLGNARGLLFPIDWPEPFGLVMIEAMACGTPVIAYPCGAVPEIVTDGQNGFLITSLETGVQALRRLDELDRSLIRKVFDERFNARIMTENYLYNYERLSGKPANLNEDTLIA